MTRDRGDNERCTERGVLEVFEAVDGPVVTSEDVAEFLGMSLETGRRELETLEERGLLSRRKTAGGNVWWIADEQATVEGIDPEDSFWDFEPSASGESDVSERVSESLYADESK